MKKYDEIVAKMHRHFVKDDYIQIMLAYRNYLLLFGELTTKTINLKECNPGEYFT